MKRHVVMFDLDGVLADFLAAYRAVQKGWGQEPTMEPRWDAYWDKAVWAYIKHSQEFWAKVPLLTDLDTMRRINDLTFAHDVYFVTNRPGVNVKFQTERWLRMKGVASPTVMISGRKGDMAAALGAEFSIDDKAGNAIATTWVAPKTKSFLLDAPYNQFNHDVVGGSVIRVKTVNQFLDEVVR